MTMGGFLGLCKGLGSGVKGVASSQTTVAVDMEQTKEARQGEGVPCTRARKNVSRLIAGQKGKESEAPRMKRGRPRVDQENAVNETRSIGGEGTTRSPGMKHGQPTGTRTLIDRSQHNS